MIPSSRMSKIRGREPRDQQIAVDTPRPLIIFTKRHLSMKALVLDGEFDPAS